MAVVLRVVTPELLVFCSVFVALAIAILAKPVRRRRIRRSAPPRRLYGPSGNVVAFDPTDPAEQLRAVMAGRFTRKPVLSLSEFKVMRAAEAAIAEAGLPWRVLAQVALGEVLASPDDAAFRAINAKRVDLLIVSDRSLPLAAIEYQGEGHWQGSAPARDAVKKEALRRAGVAYIEVSPKHDAADLRREIARLAMSAWRDAPRARVAGNAG